MKPGQETPEDKYWPNKIEGLIDNLRFRIEALEKASSLNPNAGGVSANPLLSDVDSLKEFMNRVGALLVCIENSADGTITRNGSEMQRVCNVIVNTGQFIDVKNRFDKYVKQLIEG